MAVVRASLVRVSWPDGEDPTGCWLGVLVAVAVILIALWAGSVWLGELLYP